MAKSLHLVLCSTRFSKKFCAGHSSTVSLRRPPDAKNSVVSSWSDFHSGDVEELKKQDVVAIAATALYLTIHIAQAIHKIRDEEKFHRRIVYDLTLFPGGGTQNSTLLAMLANEVKPLGLQLRFSERIRNSFRSAKEAVAFALLAYQTWNRQPSNVPSATGARRPAVLGKVSYV